MRLRYQTVFRQSEVEIIEKKSRFIATVSPVADEGQALRFLDAMRKKYKDASHNVFAYQVGLDVEITRMSDDGEPSGTAGLPILDVLRGQNLKNTAVNVTRYFGGSLLGTGGLARAYGRAAKNGVEAAGVIEYRHHTPLYLTVAYPLLGKVTHHAMQNGHVIHDTIYTETVTFYFFVETPKLDSFIRQITDITNATAQIQLCEPVYGTVYKDLFREAAPL